MLRRIAFILVAWGLILGVTAVLFVLFHSGQWGVKVCEAQGSGGPGTVSTFPFGARCDTGDEFGDTFTRMSPIFSAIVLFVVLPSLGGTWWLSRRFTRSAGAAPA